MRIGDIQYLKLVDKLMGHKLTVMTESEARAEIEAIQDGAVSSFAADANLAIIEAEHGPDLGLKLNADGSMEGFPIKKRRGRPKGSKNKSK